MLPTLVLCVVLSGAAEPSDPDLTPSDTSAAKATPGMNEDAVKFDELPVATPKVNDDARVKQFLGAFAGGLVGFAAMVALMPLDQTLGASCLGCIGPFQLLLSVLAPVVSMTAAWGVHSALGGKGGLLTPYVAFFPAVILALIMINIARDIDVTTTVGHVPFLAAAGFFLAGGSAIALDLRGRQLDGLGTTSRWGGADAGRVAVTTLVSAATTTVAALLSIGLGALSPFLGIAAGLVQSVGVAAAIWGTHKALRGRGTLGAALAGVGLAGLFTFASVGLYALAQNFFGGISSLRTTTGAMLATELGVVSAMFAGTLALEFSHTAEIEAAMPKFQIGAAPMRDGGLVSAGMRF
ncbi:MAG: hypothetical protein QM817_34325 [Archangium sp.]